MSDPTGSDPGRPNVEPSAATVSRGAWIGGLAAGVLVGVIGIGTLSFFEVHKLVQVAVEMVTVGAALLVTTRIWQSSAVAGTTERNEER